MEREEKLARLLWKVQHRRSKELKFKKQTVEQQQEERERIAMAREERHTRLLAKLAARQAQMKKSAASVSTTTSGGAAPHASAIATTTTTLSMRTKASRSRTELHSTGDTRKHAKSDPQDDDNEDMSFLDIDFKIPEAMQRGKAATTKAVGGKKAKRRLHKATRRSSGDDKSSVATQSADGNNQDEISLDAAGLTHGSHQIAEANDFDYGNEFEEVIDEVELGRLIC